MLFLHGYTGGRFELEPTFKYLKKRYDFDYEFPVYPGHGYTLSLVGLAGDDWYQEAEKAYFNLTKRVDEIYIIGYSMGGVFASYLAQNYHVDKLILIAPAFDHTKISKLHRLNLSSSVVKDHLRYNMIRRVSPRLKNIPLRAMNEFVKIVEAKTGDLRKVTCPVIFIHGKIDLLVPYQASVKAHEQMPNSQLFLLEHGPHLLMFTEEKLLEANILVERFCFKGSQEKTL
nr:alpha/beta fold hydrolase [Jeotgalicoccus marinus]